MSFKEFIEILTAIGTLGSAIFAAVSAKASRDSVDTSQKLLNEAKASRDAELLPRLILEKDFFDLQFSWPHPESLNGEAVFLSRKHWQDKAPLPPKFSLTNHSQSPALEITVQFGLTDPNGALELDQEWRDKGISVELMACDIEKIPSLQFKTGTGTTGLAVYRGYTLSLPNCSPGQTREVEFPVSLLARLFIRGLQNCQSALLHHPIEEIILTTKITAHTIAGATQQTQFRWRILPFSYGGEFPVRVHAHCFELPMYPTPVTKAIV